MKTPRILLLSPFFSPNIGGVETHLDDLVEALDQHQHRVTVLTYQPLTAREKMNAPAHENHGNVSIRRISWPGKDLFHRLLHLPLIDLLYLFPGLFAVAFWELLRTRGRYGSSEKYDVIHAHGLVAALIGMTLKVFFQIPVIMQVHTIYNWNPDSLKVKLLRLVLRHLERVLYLNPESREDLKQLGLPAHRMDEYHYWINSKFFKAGHQDSARTNLGLDNRFTMLFIGRLLEIKGVRLVMQLAEKLSDRYRIIVVGTGPLEDEVRQHADKHENFIFLGKVPNHKLKDYLVASDLLLVPSQYPEVFARVNIEALACGLPVIASNRGGIPYVLGNKAAHLCDPSLDKFLPAILELAENPPQLAEMKRQARIRYKEMYTEHNVETILRAYHQVSGRQDWDNSQLPTEAS